MPTDVATTWYRTEDGRNVTVGDRAFNYYDLKPGTIVRDAGRGWFDFRQDDGTTKLLDGHRICSMMWAEYRYPRYI